MLVRCEHCGSALPQEASKCFKCGNERTPQVYSRTEIEIPNPSLGRRKRRWAKINRIIAIASLLLILTGIILIIVGFILMDNPSDVNSQDYLYYDKNKPPQEAIMALSGVVCFVVGFALAFFILWYESTLQTKTRVVEENKLKKTDKAEYERRIRDFIGK